MVYLLLLIAVLLPAVTPATTCESSDISDLIQRVVVLEQADRSKTQEIQDDKALIHKLVTELSESKAHIESQGNTLAKTNVILLEQQRELSSLKTQMSAQENRIKELWAFLKRDTKHTDETTDTTGNLDRVEAIRSHTHSEALHSHTNKTARNNYARTAKKPANTSIRSIAETDVAFHATIDKGTVSHVGVGQKIVYDVVLLNHGNGYHGQHGLFIAPQAGVYLFATSILDVSHGDQVRVSLMKNGVVIGRALADPVTPGPTSQGSVTAIVELAVGDEVWVELTGNPDTSYYGHRFTTFCGVLIY